MGNEPEQIAAGLLRTLHKLGLVNADTAHRLIDQWQIRLFERYLKSQDQPDPQ